MTTEAQRRELEASIRLAFARVVRPAKDLIALHQCDECEELRCAFVSQRWEAMSGELIERHYVSLPLLSPEAFVYFLPAYILHSLDHFSPTSTVAEFTVYAVSPGANSDLGLEDWAVQRLAPFTNEQASAVDQFLELVERDEDVGPYISDISERRERFRELRAKSSEL
jgi:hypothetical protein